jgi:hypothetical protein
MLGRTEGMEFILNRQDTKIAKASHSERSEESSLRHARFLGFARNDNFVKTVFASD